MGSSVLNEVQLDLTATRWAAEAVARIADASIPAIPVIGASEVRPLVPGFDLWDSWPVQTRDGRNADLDGTTLWMMLSSRMLPDPALRHGEARIRLIAQIGNDWIDCGNALPDGLAPGAREWAGSTILDDDGRTVTLYFTATGRPGEPLSFEQRLFETTGSLRADNRAIEGWSAPVEIVASDGDHYVDTRTTHGGPGLIKGFRDPGYLRDPADGAEYLVFTGSDGRDDHTYNGVVGLIRRTGSGAWSVQRTRTPAHHNPRRVLLFVLVNAAPRFCARWPNRPKWALRCRC
jgi:levansucrase